MKICSYNVNSIRARLDLLLKWLEHRGQDLDVLCLQELKGEENTFPYPELEALGCHCSVYGQKAYNGVAICSQSPLKDVTEGFGQAEWDTQKRVISADINDFRLMNLYVPHGGERGDDKFNYKQGWYAQLISYLDQHFTPDSPLLLVGDFNVAHQDQDVYSAEELKDTIGTMPEEREAFSRLLDWGFTDIHRRFHPQTRQFTWWSYLGGAIWKDQGMRIDYALGTPPILERITDIEVDLWPRRRRSPTPSDHAPLIVTLKD